MEKQTIAIDAEVAAWLEKQPKKHSQGWQSDPLTDAKILAGWTVMMRKDLARAIGISEQTLRKRHEILMGDK